MAEYIEREAANEALRECVRAYPFSFYNGIEVARTTIIKLPVADVRPVVLCRDCIHLSGVTNGGSFFRCDRYDRWQDESNRVYMPLDGFCCYGQKKEEES